MVLHFLRPSATLPTLAVSALAVAALLACKEGKKEVSSDTKSAPAAEVAEAKPDVPRPESAQKPDEPKPDATEEGDGPQAPPVPATRRLRPDEIGPLVKQIMAGHRVIADQSFALQLAGFADGAFLATVAPNEKEFVFHIFQNGTRVISLLDDEDSRTYRTAVKLLGVSFPDVDRDGSDDIIVLGVYSAPTGQDVRGAAIYLRRGRGFQIDKARTGRVNQLDQVPASLSAVLKVARGG